MFKHVYPPWHKTPQRCLSIVAAILCITLPVAYGKHHISSATLGSVLGIFFGFWLAFSLFVRFCIPSPQFESSLPIYTHSPPPTPIVFHSPARSDALPSAPAIRLHPPSTAPAEASGAVVTKGARFADSLPGNRQSEEILSPPAPARVHHNVTFQTRPRGNTADSTNSLVYPTFAAYRQAQHGNFEAMAQRVKRAFAMSQQQQQQREEEESKQQQFKEKEQQQKESQELQLRPTNNITLSSSSVQSALSPPSLPTATGTRSRSASAASMLGDFAERFKNGTLFKRSPTTNTVPTTALEGATPSHDGSGGGSMLGSSNMNSKVNAATEQQGSSPLDEFGTPSEDDHPDSDGLTGARAADHADMTSQPTATTPPATATRPGYSRSHTQESSPLVTNC